MCRKPAMSSLSSSSTISFVSAVQKSPSLATTVASSSIEEVPSNGEELLEIPIYVRGEQRWISGITNDTTCAQLIDALLRDEGILIESNGKSYMTTTTSPTTLSSSKTNVQPNQYVITERWKRVEQILENKTKILQIWNAWGVNKSEVRLSLRRMETSHHHTDLNHNRNQQMNHDHDSGRESPDDRADSAIARRKRHRSSRTTPAWVTHAQTIHPKSSKTTIEKLMKLILEQGETIQQQLSKLRDREHEISKIEEERHHLREKEHGKNYLLETYLNGMHEAVDDKEITTGNSDSGVHTEEVTTSPEVGAISSPIHEDIDDDNNDVGDVDDAGSGGIADNFTKQTKERLQNNGVSDKKGKRLLNVEKRKSSTISLREAKLLKEHQTRKEFCEKTAAANDNGENVNEVMENHEEPCTSSSIACNDVDELGAQIELLEKVVAMNKHIQREEELLVRLNAKLRKYELNDPNLTETDIKEALTRINQSIEDGSTEMEKVDQELDVSREILAVKSDIVTKLTKELEELEVSKKQSTTILIPRSQIQIHSNRNVEENIMTIEPTSSALASISDETSVTPSLNQPINENINEQMHFYTSILPCPTVKSQVAKTTDATVAITATTPKQSYLIPDHIIFNRTSCFFQKSDYYTYDNVNLLNLNDQRNLNKAPTMMNCIKVGPKKLMNGFYKDPGSDTGLSSLGEDSSQLGTLV